MKPFLAPLIALPFLLGACVAPQHMEVRAAQPVKPGQHPQSPLYEWHGDDLTGPLAVRISLAEQKAYLTRGGQPAGWTYVATGRPSHPTPRGRFRVTEKKRDKHSNKYGMIVSSSGAIVNGNATAGVSRVPSGGRYVPAAMPCWMRLTSYGVGMHAGPIPDPGYPASHGCIRLPTAMAETLFEIATVGTPVVIE